MWLWIVLALVFFGLFFAQLALLARTHTVKGCFILPALSVIAFLIALYGSIVVTGWDQIGWAYFALLFGIALFGCLLGSVIGWDVRRFGHDRETMKRKNTLRLISLAMFVAAIIFVACALANPTLGSAFYIGSFRVGADVWRVCYAIYVIVMVMLFLISFFVRKKK